MNAMTLLLLGPLCGVQKRKPDVLHAVTSDALHDVVNCRTMTAPCGARHIRFLVMEGDRHGATQVLLWPPSAKGQWTRCRDCWVATGKKRPRKAKR